MPVFYSYLFCHQPVHNSGSSGYSSHPKTNVFRPTSLSEGTSSRDKTQEREEPSCSNARPVRTSKEWSLLCHITVNISLFIVKHWSPSQDPKKCFTITCHSVVTISRLTFQEICKGIHLQKSQEQQTNEVDNKKSSSSKLSLEYHVVRSVAETSAHSNDCPAPVSPPLPSRGCREGSYGGAAQRLGSSAQPQRVRSCSGGEQALFPGGNGLR